jgi:hypothetical protein
VGLLVAGLLATTTLHCAHIYLQRVPPDIFDNRLRNCHRVIIRVKPTVKAPHSDERLEVSFGA